MKTSLSSRSRRALLLSAPALAWGLTRPTFAQAGFDHRHAAWDALLRQHVVVAPNGFSSAVRYGAFKAQQPALKAYTDSLSAVTMATYTGWSKPQRLAFLINAYNAFTVELILSKYPDLKSIKDLGSVFESPWKKKFFRLLGQERTLDDVEHGLIRAPGVFDDPRIHVAVVCASIGCPMLRNEAFVAERLDIQLDDAMRRFLSDRTRNRFAGGKLEVSKIFDWYGEDFRLGHRGIASLPAFLARYADVLAEAPADRERVRAQKAELGFLDYDWKLNDAR